MVIISPNRGVMPLCAWNLLVVPGVWLIIMGIFNGLKSWSKSFDALIRPHLKDMYYQAYRLLNNQSDAEDLVQDFVLKLYKNKPKLHEVEHLRSWLYKGLYRQFLNHIRNESRNPLNSRDYEDDELDEVSHHNPSPELLTEREIEIEYVQKALTELSPNHREIIIMHDIEGFSMIEIGDFMDCPVGTVKSRLHRARENLKQQLSNQSELFGQSREPLAQN